MISHHTIGEILELGQLCEHLADLQADEVDIQLPQIHHIVEGPIGVEDFDWCGAMQGYAPVHLLCERCAEDLPSAKQKRGKAEQREVDRKREQADDLAELLEQIEGGEPMFWCPGCGEVKHEDDVVVVRECPMESCGDLRFDGSDGPNCPDCNRPFSRKIAERGCQDCLDDEDLEEITTEEQLKEVLNDD